MTGYSSLTHGDWECMVCHAMRGYRDIEVAHRPLAGFEAQFPGSRVNVRFCTDNPECRATATAEGPWPPL